MNGYITAKEVTKFVQLSLQTIRRYTMQKKIPFHKIDRAVRFKKTEIEQWVETRKAYSQLKQCAVFKNDADLLANEQEFFIGSDSGANNDWLRKNCRRSKEWNSAV